MNRLAGCRVAGLAVLLAVPLGAQQQALTLQQAVDRAQKQGYAAGAAVAVRDAARAREHGFSMRKLPQLSLVGSAPEYRKDISPVVQADGSTLFLPVEQTTASAGLRISQQFPLTGANFSVTSQLTRLDRTGGTAGSSRLWTSNPVTFQIQQPILRANQQAWSSRIEDLMLDVAERAYLEAREGIAIAATTAFFDLYVARKQLDNAEQNVARNDTLYTINKGRLEIGKIGENDLLQSELSLLRTRSQAENARLTYLRAAAAYRLTLNLPATAPLDVVPPLVVPSVAADTLVAVEHALRNRAPIKEIEVQTTAARRDLRSVRYLGGQDFANITASFGLNQTAPDMNLVYQDPLQSQRFSFGVQLPVITWGARGADVQQARANLRRVEANAKLTREQVIQDAHFAALQLDQAKRNLDLAGKADTVAQKRYEVAYNRYVIGKINVDNLYIAQNEKDNAVNAYLEALRSYWVAYYRLRQVTLYDFERKQTIQ